MMSSRMQGLQALCAAALTAATFTAGTLQTAAAQDRAAIEKIVREYILEHPEVVMEAIQKLRERKQAAEEETDRNMVAANRTQIFDAPDAAVGGNPEGDVTVVEFFDYRCGVCRRVHPIVAKLIETDANIRRVYKEWPILGINSVTASRAAIAARRQGHYLAFHDALMESRSALEEADVMRIAKSVGIDVERLRRDMQAAEVNATIQRNYELAEKLKLNGTPSFLIGDRIIRGGQDLDTMRKLVAEARAAKE